jgi:hypothetical protein
MKYYSSDLHKIYKMNLYTLKIREYETLSLTDDGMNLIRTPYPVDINDREHKDYDDLFHDYLAFPDLNFSADDIKLLTDNGYDLDRTHYATIECTYLPFVHFLHLTEHWII